MFFLRSTEWLRNWGNKIALQWQRPRCLTEPDPYPEPIFLYVYEAQESIPRNEFRQPL